MGWETCKKEHIREVEPDIEKINSIRKMCSVRQRIVRSIPIDKETASVATEDYYEIIKELLIALLLSYGYKSDNHECLVSFFKKQYQSYEYEAGIIHELKNIRNRITYDGIFVKKEYFDSNKLEFEHIIELLNKLVDEKIK